VLAALIPRNRNAGEVPNTATGELVDAKS